MKPMTLRVVPGAICLDSDSATSKERATDVDTFEALRREHHLILNAAGEGIYGLDLDGRAHFVNPAAAAMTGHRVEELIGCSMHDLVHHSYADGRAYESSDCPIYHAFTDGMVHKVTDEVFWRKDGTSFPVEYTSTPLLSSGRLVGAVVVFRDVTIRKYTEDRLRQALSEVERLKEKLQEENRVLKARIENGSASPTIVGKSPALIRMLDLIRRVAPTEATVLVLGESGTGKELVARAVHEQSERRERPLVALNCAALSPSLVESELFGHERGSFTGAASTRPGRFELAEGGTLFLDEIGELPLEAQAKLLRVLEERQYERVGGTRTLRATARIIAATNRNLKQLVAEGRFRGDLYYRLFVVPISVPALRERREDIPLLARHFLDACSARWGKHFDGIDSKTLERMRRYSWPGNVRELEHAIERGALISDGPRLHVEQLEEGVSSELACDSGVAPSGTLEGVQREHILRTLESTDYRISGPGGAAERLGIHPNTLRYRMSRLGIRTRRGHRDW